MNSLVIMNALLLGLAGSLAPSPMSPKIGLALSPRVSITCGLQGPAKSPWPKYHADARNTGLGAASGATGKLKWKFNAGGGMFLATPTIAPDGTIYAANDNGYLYAVNADGTQKWKFAVTGELLGSPAVDSNGTIYQGSYGGNF